MTPEPEGPPVRDVVAEATLSGAGDSSQNRLSILYLMAVTTGVAIAISVSRGIERLRFPADAFYYNRERIEVDGFSLLIAAVYGVCVTTMLFAWRSGSRWDSPGKTLALLFSTMCILNWAFDFLAAVVMHSRMQTPVPETAADTRGYIAGIWYRYLAAAIGYVAGLPILALAVWKTRAQPFSWRLVWVGYLGFALLIAGDIHFRWGRQLPVSIRDWYFELAIGIPITLMALALVVAMVRRESIDWWTAILAPLIISVWIVGMVIKAVAAVSANV